MTLHHIALGARDVERVAEFYRIAFELEETARHHTESGALRSIWLELSPGTLMIEATEASRSRVDGVGAGPFLLAFAVSCEQRAVWEERLEQLGHPIEDRTDYTSYARDPEGNRVAVSHYPETQ